jgi:heme exporter protein C
MSELLATVKVLALLGGIGAVVGVLARRAPWLLGVLGAALFLFSQALGLFWVSQEAHMGEVGRILYVHVPAAWLSMLVYTIAFVAALGHLWTSRPTWDWAVEASIEVGVVLNVLLLVLGSLFARPTWGVWWDWDPRLTASAVMLLTFVGVMLLRSLVDDPERRALWSSVTTVLAFVNIPITYMSVRWWRSLHQVQSTSSTMSPDMALVLRISALAFLFLSVWAITQRYRIAATRGAVLIAPPLPEAR